MRAPTSHQALASAVLKRLAEVDPDGSRLSTADVEQVADLAVEQILDPSIRWVEQLGSFYDVEGVRTLLSHGSLITRQAVSKRKGLLALTTGSGRVVYPAFQFRDRRPAPGLDRVLDALPEALLSRWTLASWLSSPELDLDRERPIDVLFEETPAALDAVLAVAQQWAARLAA